MQDLMKKYGKGWVLITGGTDGIGKAFGFVTIIRFYTKNQFIIFF